MLLKQTANSLNKGAWVRLISDTTVLWSFLLASVTNLDYAAFYNSADVFSPLRHPGVQLIQIRGKGQSM